MPQKSTERPRAITSGTLRPAAASSSSLVGLRPAAVNARAPASYCLPNLSRYSTEFMKPSTIVRKSVGLAFR